MVNCNMYHMVNCNMYYLVSRGHVGARRAAARRGLHGAAWRLPPGLPEGVGNFKDTVFIFFYASFWDYSKHSWIQNSCAFVSSNGAPLTVHVIQYPWSPPRRGVPRRRRSTTGAFRDFKDTVYAFFESDALFRECCCCIVFSCLATLRIEGCLNSTL